jgi:hypothetical protein
MAGDAPHIGAPSSVAAPDTPAATAPASEHQSAMELEEPEEDAPQPMQEASHAALAFA